MMRWLDMPPVWLVVFMVLAWAASGAEAAWGAGAGWQTTLLWAGRALIATGLAIAFWSMVAFRRARTTIIPKEQPTALVDTGPFQFSRNPIYLADLIILAGWGLTLAAPLTLVLLVPFWWVLTTRFIEPEENVLTDILGPEYIAYKSRVRRWI